MSIFEDENDLNLPGVITEVESDFAYGYDTSKFSTTDSVVIIGTAFNGPVGQATAVYSPEHASYVFGAAYDQKHNIEASLVKGIQDAWDRGARQIYACRVGGKDMYKDYNFNVDSKYHLRLRTMFPSNIGKDCYVVYDSTLGDEKITFYKPASRATIAEKKRGLVNGENAILKTTIQLGSDYGLTADSRLVTAIDNFNSHSFNNVLLLSIVDDEGNDVTRTKEAYNIPLGVMYPGLYTVGRDHSNCAELTKKNFETIKYDDNGNPLNAPWANYDEPYFHELEINTDVRQPLPIYSKSFNMLKTALRKSGIVMSKSWDFLEVKNGADRAFAKDKKDYEEADISGFKLYQRLGNGYGITAHAIKREHMNAEGRVVELTPRIKETSLGDENRIMPITEGIYSVLQNAEIKYRVLNCANADDKAVGYLPKASEFLRTSSSDASIIDGYVKFFSKVDKMDYTAPKKYHFEVRSIDKALFDDKNDIYEGQIFKVLPLITQKEAENGDKVEPGTEALVKYEIQVKNGDPQPGSQPGSQAGSQSGSQPVQTTTEIKLVRFGTTGLTQVEGDYLKGRGYLAMENGEMKLFMGDAAGLFHEVTPIAGTEKNGKACKILPNAGGNKYILGESLEHVFVFECTDTGVKALGDLKSMLTAEEETLLVYAESHNFGVNNVIIESTMFDTITLEEFVDSMRENEIISKVFDVELDNQTGAEHKGEIVSELLYEQAITTDQPDTIYYQASEDPNAPLTTDKTKALKDKNGHEIVAKVIEGKKKHGVNNVADMDEDRTTAYDYNLYIPYRSVDNFARQLAQHCTSTELHTCPTWGFIGHGNLSNVSIQGIADAVNAAAERDYDLFAKNAVGRDLFDRTNTPYPIGKNVSIVFAQYPVTMDDDGYTGYSNGAAGYAGMVATLPLDRSSTNQPINVTTPSFTLTESQLKKLTGKGIVTFRQSFTKGIVVTDGITMAPAESVFRRLSASRVVGAVEDLIRKAAEPFIGLQNHTANRNALNTAIEAALASIKGKLINNYKFTMSSDANLEKLSIIKIDYQIVPVYEIREVRNTIKVKDSIEQ